MLAPAEQASAVPLSHTLDSSPVTSVFSEQLPYHLKLSPRLCLCFPSRFGVSEVSQSCVTFVLTEFSSPSFGVSWDHLGRCSCQLSAFALLCLVSQPVLGLSSSCPLAPVPPGTALVSCTACEGRNQLKEKTQEALAVPLAVPLRATPYHVSFGVRLWGLSASTAPISFVVPLSMGINALCWFPF